MATEDEILVLAQGLRDGALHPDVGGWWEPLTDLERRDVMVLAGYMAVYDRKRRTGNDAAQRKAMKLLRSYLTVEQRAEVTRSRQFYVTGSAGGQYRILPACGITEQVRKYGTRWFAVLRFCYHDEFELMPKADRSLAHLLFLRTDEPRFLELANKTATGPDGENAMLWNPLWGQRLLEARRLNDDCAADMVAWHRERTVMIPEPFEPVVNADESRDL